MIKLNKISIFYYTYIILFIFLSYTVSQLEFPTNKMSKKERVKFPIEAFSVDYYPSDTNLTLIRMSQSSDDLYTIHLNLGTPSRRYTFVVDTGSSVLWIPNFETKNCSYHSGKFNESLTTSLVKTKQRVNNLPLTKNTISGEVCYETVTLDEEIEIPSFKFLLVDKIENPIEDNGMLGLSRIYPDYDYSFIDFLYRKGLIAKRIFSQKIDEDCHDSKLMIGEIPNEIRNDIKFFTKCKTVDDTNVKNKWACNLNQILIIKKIAKDTWSFFRNIEQEFKFFGEPKPAIFDTGSNIVVAPEIYFEIFKENFFKEMIEEELCFIINDKDGTRGFECTSEAKLEDLPELRFVFDNEFTYKININNLFKRNYDKNLFRIIFGNIAGDVWILGQTFLKQYHMVFDMEDLTVGLYPHKYKGFIVNTVIKTSEFKLEHYDHTIDINKKIDEDEVNVHFYLKLLVCGAILLCLLIFIIVRKLKKRYTDNKIFEGESSCNISMINTGD